ncbi:MAG: sugar-binding protein [Armatimonadota bacterium]
MRRFIYLLSLLLVVAGISSAVLVKTPEQFLILKPTKPIVIDGKLGEWDMAHTPCVITPDISKPKSVVYVNDAAHPVKGDADISGRVAFAWDETYFYIAADITDDHLDGIKPDSAGNQGPAPWACDSVMVVVNSFRQPMKANALTSTDPCIALRYAPTGPQPRGSLLPSPNGELDKRGTFWMITPNGKWASGETQNGYAVEAAIPWKDLAYTPHAGERLFIAVLVPDIDPGQTLKQVGWGYDGPISAHPAFRLAEREDALGILTTSTDELTPVAPWTVRVDVDALKSTAKLQKIRVVNARGATVLEQPARLEVTAGMSGVALCEFPAGALAKPGQYMVQALAATPRGSTVLASVPLTVVEPTPATPVVSNFPGEIHHLRPARLTHNAFTDHRRNRIRHGFVQGKEDYVPYIKKYVEPGMKDTIRRMIAGKDRFMFSELLYCLSLYRITGDEEYVKLGRELMDTILTVGGIDSFKLTDIAAFRYLTWKKDPASPWAPKDAEARYRKLFYPIVAKPDSYYFAESGTHNRIWHRYAVLKVGRMIAEEDGQPVDKRVLDYTNYHDKLIGEVGDADDASSGYHWVWSQPALGIYFHTGNWDAFLKNKGFIKAFDRYVEMVSPSGGCPTFGADGGWPQQGQSTWMFELMSTLTHNGRYRWASHRTMEYFYNHLYDDAGQYHGPFDQARYNFAVAYLFADDSVKPVYPSPTSRITWRHAFDAVPIEDQRAHPGLGTKMMNPTTWIPDKMVLSGGNDPKSLWALIDLLPGGGHGGETPGNICAMLQQDAVLMGGQGYYEVSQQFQNLLWIEDLDGLPADPRTMTTSLPLYADDPSFTFARISTVAYQHLPVTYARDIFFYKNGFMVIKDRAKFDATMKVRLGPCQQTRDLGPQCGANWFNTYYDELYWTGLGLGYGVQSFQNPAWDMLVYFTPRADRKCTVQDDYLKNPYRLSPITLRQVWSGMARAGQELTFTTVLLPHAPMLSPKDLIEPPAGSKDPARIEVVRDDDHVTVLKVIYETDPVNKTRYETWLMLNDTGTVVKAGPLESDAAVAMVDLDGKGNIINRVMSGGTLLRFKDADLSTAARKPKLGPVEVPAALLK